MGHFLQLAHESGGEHRQARIWGKVLKIRRSCVGTGQEAFPGITGTGLLLPRLCLHKFEDLRQIQKTTLFPLFQGTFYPATSYHLEPS